MTASTDDLKSVTVSIVTYNSRAVIGECLAALPIGVEVLVYDNASSDDTVSYIRERFPRVQLFAGEKNLGFGSAHNRNRAKVDTPFALVLNPDCFVTETAIRRMLAAICSAADVALVGPTGTQESSKDIPADRGLSEVEILSGACLLLRVSAFDSHWFDENLFLFHEDTDLCLNARNAGWRLLVDPHAVVTHLTGESSPRSFAMNQRRSFHLGWSECYFKCKYRGGRSAVAVIARILLRHLAKMLQRLLRFSPKAAESLARVYGVIVFCLKPLVVTPSLSSHQAREAMESASKSRAA